MTTSGRSTAVLVGAAILIIGLVVVVIVLAVRLRRRPATGDSYRRGQSGPADDDVPAAQADDPTQPSDPATKQVPMRTRDQPRPPHRDAVSGISTSTATSGGLRRLLATTDGQRRYVLHVPPRPARTPTPLLLMLHPGFGSAEGFERLTAINGAASDRGFLVAYPQGYLRSWNAGECCGPALRDGIDDVAFLREVIMDASRTAGVAVQVFPVGFSNGAAMAYRLGCEVADEVAGIVAVGSAMRVSEADCHPTRPIPILHLHGDLDRFAPLHGGVGVREQAGQQPPVERTVEFWARHNGWAGPVDARRDGAVITQRRGAEGRAPVVQVIVEGLGHQWPGGPGFRPDIFGPQTASPSATQLALDFIDACRRRSS
jgi:polyhydroxybutyrate depolymerase